ncbi:MAG: SDR family oxidoreductase [Anaerolineae bacterium]|nr:SDR family oxidoreductase [Anaerolineae bacterium]
MNREISPHVAVITGASRGLGEVLARFLAGQGYHLILNARGGAALDAVVRSLAGYDVQVKAIAGDVAEPSARRAIVQLAKALGGLDILINNASILGASPLVPLAQHPLDALEDVYRANVIAPLALVQEALPLLKASHGLVVNISSDAARGGYETWGGYGSSKAALDLISLTLANELKGEGVSVVSVDPGDMRTDMHQAAYLGQDISDRPLPDVTLPFWAWLFGQDRMAISGGRYQAQSEQWEAAHEAQ